MSEKTFRIQDLPNIWDLNMEQEYLIEGLFPESSLILLTGESGHGKSTVVLSLANAVATGSTFLGRKCEQRKVLFIDGENGLQVYHERFRRLNIQENKNMFFWGLWFRPEPNSDGLKAKTQTFRELMRFAAEERPLLVFDSLVAFHPGSEQDSSETRSYMDQFRQLANVGATVIVIHHIGKGDSAKEYRGSSDIKASVDVAFLLTAKKPLLKELELKPYKSREGALDSLSFGLEGTTFVVHNAKGALWNQLIETVQRNPGCKQGELMALLPAIGNFVLRNMLEEGVVNGTLEIVIGERNAHHYYLNGQKPLKN